MVLQNIDERGTGLNEKILMGEEECLLRPGDVITVVERCFRYENPHFAARFPEDLVPEPAVESAQGTPSKLKPLLDEIVPGSAQKTPRRLLQQQQQAASPRVATPTAETFNVTPARAMSPSNNVESSPSRFRVTPLKLGEEQPVRTPITATPLACPSKLGQSPVGRTPSGSVLGSAQRLQSTPRTPRATIPGSPTVVDSEIVASPKLSKGEIYEYPITADGVDSGESLLDTPSVELALESPMEIDSEPVTVSEANILAKPDETENPLFTPAEPINEQEAVNNPSATEHEPVQEASEAVVAEEACEIAVVQEEEASPEDVVMTEAEAVPIVTEVTESKGTEQAEEVAEVMETAQVISTEPTNTDDVVVAEDNEPNPFIEVAPEAVSQEPVTAETVEEKISVVAGSVLKEAYVTVDAEMAVEPEDELETFAQPEIHVETECTVVTEIVVETEAVVEPEIAPETAIVEDPVVTEVEPAVAVPEVPVETAEELAHGKETVQEDPIQSQEQKTSEVAPAEPTEADLALINAIQQEEGTPRRSSRHSSPYARSAKKASSSALSTPLRASSKRDSLTGNEVMLDEEPAPSTAKRGRRASAVLAKTPASSARRSNRTAATPKLAQSPSLRNTPTEEEEAEEIEDGENAQPTVNEQNEQAAPAPRKRGRPRKSDVKGDATTPVSKSARV